MKPSILQLSLLFILSLQSLSCSAAEPKAAAAPENEPRAGEDWPVFLGNSGVGISSETGLLKDWPAGGPPQLWEVEIGTGYSAPSVRGDFVVCHHRQGDQEIVQCFDVRTAKSLWKYESPSNFSDPYGYNNGPRCSPLLTEDRCYTFGAEGRLLCLNLADGKLIWERETHKDFNVPDAFFGVGATPILEGDKLVVLVGGQPNAGVVAFDANNGKTLWQNTGRDTWDGSPTGWRGEENYEWTGEEMVVSYSSPIAATLHGKRHVFCLLRHGLVSLDPETGKENFHYWFRSRDHESVNAARPVVIGNRVLITAAYRTGAALLEINPDGTSFTEVWRNEDNMLAHWSTPIPVGDYVYGFSGRHENGSTLRCLKIDTGEVVWETIGWEGPVTQFTPASNSSVRNKETDAIEPWPYYGRGSMILVEDQFIVLGERGTVALVDASPKGFREIDRFKPESMNYPCWAAPVLSRGRMFLRSENSLLCYDLKAPAKKDQP